ncbi:MAG: HRDC domain-containing protein [Bacteroidota bacterium]
MSATHTDYQFIDNQKALEEFHQKNASIEWMAFDTEFVGEKRFHTKICLIQVASEHGNFLIDPLKIEDWQPFLNLIENENILKITHAGENDYRLLFQQHDVLPKNVFDTQIAAGLVGYNYPVAFQKLVAKELNLFLKKGYAVADWEARPLDEQQLKYALNDVLYLKELYNRLYDKLEAQKRLEWAFEEFEVLENASYYMRDPNKEILDSNLMRVLRKKEQLFLMRLYKWRQEEARNKNYSKEMILPNKMMGHVVRSIGSGKAALKNNRRIPAKLSKNYGDLFEEMYNREKTEEERQVLKQLTNGHIDDPKQELLIEMLYLIVKYTCLERQVSPNMVFSKAELKKTLNNRDLALKLLGTGWRKELLGEDFSEWILNIDQLQLEVQDGKVVFQVNGKQ